jgi:hypothetical protein
MLFTDSVLSLRNLLMITQNQRLYLLDFLKFYFYDTSVY